MHEQRNPDYNMHRLGNSCITLLLLNRLLNVFTQEVGLLIQSPIQFSTRDINKTEICQIGAL